ncbi:thymidine phosphorylase [Chachezhania sediminis]|uniref:thymidine phosphorylase n=1 Tax=Chachezhania sediminis TaxID=2599291 RepID=UPI00131A6482|nr:thymidine phosphorylase [Chachezhania sediminis]
MDARTIIAGLRKGETPHRGAMSWMAKSLADGTVSDAQAGAFAMAVCLQGLNAEFRAELTLAMRDTGQVLTWNVDGPVVDKHSTGGVGDCVSFVLAPALAACGAYAPLISGRGLGHTGGTLDKLEAIPGVRTQVPPEKLQQIVGQVGCAIVGATGDIAPADRRLYAIRDVTSTVDSLDLITASILSKKLAAAPQALILDVKVGSGALMKSEAEAKALATALVETANAAGCPCRAIISDMNQPLAPVAGNALEIVAAMEVLTGEGMDSPLARIAALLGGALLTQTGLADTAEAGQTKILATLSDGSAAERFAQMIGALGGPSDFIESWRHGLPEADHIREVKAPADGYIAAIDGEALGLAVVGLGGGRQVETDPIDPAVGLTGIARLGTKVEAGAPLATIHASRDDAADRAAAAVGAAFVIADKPVEVPPLVHATVG